MTYKCICKIKQIPKREPKFHHDEIFNGAGKSMNELLIVLISEWDLQIMVISILIVEIQLFFMTSLVD